MDLTGKIQLAVRKFNLKLAGRRVLTEAATGNYVVTPVIAAAAGAKVTALTRHSSYGSIDDVRHQTQALADAMGFAGRIMIVTSLADIDLTSYDIVTNCGFLRPLDRQFISRLSPRCVIPLMYETWEFRKDEIDLTACREKGIKVYGTNEADSRLRTMEYIGLIALYFLLARKLSPFGANVLVLGCEPFVRPVAAVLARNGYAYHLVMSYAERIDVSRFNAIVVAEASDRRLLIGLDSSAFIVSGSIPPETYVVHIAGNVDFRNAPFAFTPEKPKPFGHMSYTTDFIDPQAVVDLHTAGLKVGEVMLAATDAGLQGKGFQRYVENHSPGLALEHAQEE